MVFAWSILARHDSGLGDSVVLPEDDLDFTELDAEPSDLDLMIDASQEFQVPVRVPADQVTRSVAPLAWLPQRIRHESLRGEARTIQVAASQPGSANQELTGNAGRNGPELGIDDIEA
ncbi:MAG TPA: hypothetical protein VK607_10365, partial [Kofleriaceae bacterium]|nr:hypothetical protein [Kofleriaceae bacterium]